MKRLFTFLLIVITFYSNAQWVQLPFEQENLESLYFKDANTGYVGTYSTNEELPKLFKTSDGGMNWSEIVLPEIGNYTKITTIHFFDDNTGFLTTDDQYTSLRTTDGGQNWNTIFCGIEEIYGKAYFKNDGTGFYYSTDLTTSDNQGASWTPLDINISGTGIVDIYFINGEGNIGYMVQDWDVVKTNDGGQTWTSIASWYEAGGNPSIFFLNEDLGYLTGGGAIYKTMNGGENWSNTYILGGEELYFVNENIGFAISDNFGQQSNYTILKTLDGGENWLPMYKAGSSNNVPYISHFDFPNNTTGYAISTDGHIYKLDVTAGVEDVTKNTITVYPIPATDALTINDASELLNYNYSIIDVAGKVVFSGIISSNTINISQLEQGMYFLKMREKHTVKFIKR